MEKNYKELYEQALEKAKADYVRADVNHDLLEFIFPELKESAWSDEDISKIDRLITYFRGKDNKEFTEWFSLLKDRVLPQPKQEWSEEDIDNIKNIIILCNHSIEGIECTWIPSQAAKIKKLMESILHSSKP